MFDKNTISFELVLLIFYSEDLPYVGRMFPEYFGVYNIPIKADPTIVTEACSSSSSECDLDSIPTYTFRPSSHKILWAKQQMKHLNIQAEIEHQFSDITDPSDSEASDTDNIISMNERKPFLDLCENICYRKFYAKKSLYF